MASEAAAMRRALDLAWRGWGRVQPNPMVGAVVLRDGHALAEGWHAEFGGPHAEAVALGAAGDRARGATLVVTLEPCRHQGKQPPCTEAILRAGVRRVVIGVGDPNRLAAGGADDLAAAGVAVEQARFGNQVRRQNPVFFHAFGPMAERPFVALKLATSVDGAIADRSGRSRWISGEVGRAYVHWLRAGFDAIAVGAGTARIDNPALTVRGEVTPRIPPLRIVFSRSGRIEDATQLLATARQIPVLVIGGGGEGMAAARRRALQEQGVEVLDVGAGLVAALRALRARGVWSVLVEGGAGLAGALLDASLVDRFYWIQSPVWLGAGALPAFAGLPGTGLPDAARWKVVERRPLGDDTLVVLEPERCSAAS